LLNFLSNTGTFVKFDPANDRNGPELDGFGGGVNLDGSIAYVAFASSINCLNQFLSPCALTTNSNNPGCNYQCGSTAVFDKNSTYYLQKNSNLAWVSTDALTVMNVPNTVKIVGPTIFMFGRAQVNGLYILGTVQEKNGNFVFQSLSSNGSIQALTNFEILTCYYPCCGCKFSLEFINELFTKFYIVSLHFYHNFSSSIFWLYVDDFIFCSIFRFHTFNFTLYSTFNYSTKFF
jgi:hypothetical protein